jgi:hypothetical protein
MGTEITAVLPSLPLSDGGIAMRVPKGLPGSLGDKIFDLVIGAPLAALVGTAWEQHTGRVWPAVLVGCLMFISVAGIVAFCRHQTTLRHADSIARRRRDTDTLLGTWAAHFSNGSDFTWVFKKDGTVLSSSPAAPSGEWSMDDVRVQIRWHHPDAWETLEQPLQPSCTHGKSWQPGVTLTAKKLETNSVTHS